MFRLGDFWVLDTGKNRFNLELKMHWCLQFGLNLLNVEDQLSLSLFNSDIWQWSELTSFGDLPSPRDFAAASAIANRKIVM